MTKTNKQLFDMLWDTYTDSHSTVKHCSYDSQHAVHMLDSEISCLDFDQMKETYCRTARIADVSSVDALLFKNETFYLVEFKNYDLKKENSQRKRHNQTGDRKIGVWKEIRLKVYESLAILNDIFQTDLNYQQIEVIVVQPDNQRKQTAIDNIRKHAAARAKEKDQIEYCRIFKQIYGFDSKKYSVKDFVTLILAS